MKTVQIGVFEFSELSDKAKEKAGMVPIAQGSGGAVFICHCCSRVWRVMGFMPRGQKVCDECAGLAPSDSQEVTEDMAAAGRQIAADIVNAQVAKDMDGLGGSKTWGEWLSLDIKNRDIVFEYIYGNIDSVTAIYKAMQRAKLNIIK